MTAGASSPVVILGAPSSPRPEPRLRVWGSGLLGRGPCWPAPLSISREPWWLSWSPGKTPSSVTPSGNEMSRPGAWKWNTLPWLARRLPAVRPRKDWALPQKSRKEGSLEDHPAGKSGTQHFPPPTPTSLPSASWPSYGKLKTDLCGTLGVHRERRQEKNILNSVWEKANTEKRLQGAQDQQRGHRGQGYVRGQTCQPGGSVVCQSLAMGLDKSILSSLLQCKVVTSGDSYVHQ